MVAVWGGDENSPTHPWGKIVKLQCSVDILANPTKHQPDHNDLIIQMV